MRYLLVAQSLKCDYQSVCFVLEQWCLPPICRQNTQCLSVSCDRRDCHIWSLCMVHNPHSNIVSNDTSKHDGRTNTALDFSIMWHFY